MSTPLDQFIESLKDTNGFRSGGFAVGIRGITGFAPKGFEESDGALLHYFIEALANIARHAVQTIHVNTEQVLNVGPTESNLHSYALPENKLAFDGQSIETFYGGRILPSPNDQRLRIYFSDSMVFDSGVITIVESMDWAAKVQIIRTSLTSQKVLTLFVLTSYAGDEADTEENTLRNINRICSGVWIGLIHSGSIINESDKENSCREYIGINYTNAVLDSKTSVNFSNINEDLSIENILKVTAETINSDEIIQETSKIWFSPES